MNQKEKAEIRFYPKIFLRGIFMGAADLIPGVSGGTIALITGIYERLLSALSALDHRAIKLFFNFQWKKLWKKIDGNFLISLFSGILLSVFALAKLIHFLLDKYPIVVWSFFFGLILASAVFILNETKGRFLSKVIYAVAGAVLAYWITNFIPQNGSDTSVYLFFSGIAASMAMILPGISGSYILVILGSYLYVLEAVHQLKIFKLIVFTLGIITGLLGFSKILKWFFNRFKKQTLALMSGFLIGSLKQIWPWKEILEKKVVNGKEIVVKSQAVLPWNFHGQNYLLLSVFFFITGMIIIYVFHKIQQKYA